MLRLVSAFVLTQVHSIDNDSLDVELKIMGIVIRIVEEVAASLEPHESIGHIHTLNDLDHGNVPLILGILSTQVARSWAIVFSNSGSPWAIVKCVGDILDHYAGMLEKHPLTISGA